MSDADLRGRFRRDFTKEQIGVRARSASKANPTSPKPPAAPTQPSPSLPEVAIPQIESHVRKPKVRKNRRKLWLGLFIVCLLGGGGAAFYQYSHDRQPVPTQVKQQAQIPILYPTQLPQGFAVVKSSFNVSSGNIVVYYASDNTGKRINFTVQPRPANFDFEKFYSQVMINATRFKTAAGEAAVGKANGHLLGSLATTKSWVLVTGNSDAVTADQLQTALSGMQLLQ
jgi:hypothetical protein